MKSTSGTGTAGGIVIAALVVAGGCAWHPYRVSTSPPLDRPALQQSVLASLQHRYPAPCRLKQRLALRALGRQYDMIGYLAIAPGGDFRALALGEMGGRIFDLALDQGVAKIHKKPEAMPPNPLLDGVIGDIRHLFTLPAFTHATLRTDLQGRVSLSLAGEPGAMADYDFTGDEVPELRHSQESDGRRIIREADYAEADFRLDASRRIPRRMILRNYRWHYTLEIQNLELVSGAAGPPGPETEGTAP
ncbi:MAG: hypothetical protein WCH61_05280 [bacterium]